MLDEQSVIKYGSKFLQLDRNVTIDRIKELIGKKILLTDMHDRQEIVVIHDYDDYEVSLHLYDEDNNHNVYETYDYDFPKCFIKEIEIIDK